LPGSPFPTTTLSYHAPRELSSRPHPRFQPAPPAVARPLAHLFTQALACPVIPTSGPNRWPPRHLCLGWCGARVAWMHKVGLATDPLAHLQEVMSLTVFQVSRLVRPLAESAVAS